MPGAWSNEKMHWYDAGDARAWPVGLAVFVIASTVMVVLGTGWLSLIFAVPWAAAAFNLYAATVRRRVRNSANRKA